MWQDKPFRKSRWENFKEFFEDVLFPDILGMLYGLLMGIVFIAILAGVVYLILKIGQFVGE